MMGIRWGHVPYPGTLAIGLAMCAGVQHISGSWSVAAAVTVGAMFAVVGLWEWVLPHEHTWRPSRRNLSVDIVHATVTATLVTPVVRAGLTVAIGGMLSMWVRAGVGGLWPSGLPVLVQVALAIVVADLGAYAAHRWMHLSRAGWRIHVVHHTTEEMNFVASARSHPFNAALTYVGETSLLIALGVPTPALALWTVVKATNGMLQHANIAYLPTPLAWFLATPEVHRWHHSIHLEESNTNFGNTSTVWDRVFGTLYLPSDKRPGIALGVEGTEIPENYWWHLRTPFVLARFEGSSPEA